MNAAVGLKPDRVVLVNGSTRRDCTVDEFLKLAIDQQVEMLFKGNVLFFNGATQLRTGDALKLLRQERAAMASHA